MSDAAGGSEPTVTRAHLVMVAELADAAAVTADFLEGIVGLVDGPADGHVIDRDRRRGTDRTFRRILNRSRREPVARGSAGAYGPEQLRKAANAADGMVAALEALRTVPACRPLVARLDELSIPTLPTDLWAVPSMRSPELVRLSRSLTRARLAISEATSRLTLLRLRSGAPYGSD